MLDESYYLAQRMRVEDSCKAIGICKCDGKVLTATAPDVSPRIF